MARYACRGVVRDQGGNALSGATVTVYLAGTTTLATIYAAYSGGSAVSGSAVTTGDSGSYSFFVDDADYASNQRFKLSPAKTNYALDDSDYVSILPVSASEVSMDDITSAVSAAEGWAGSAESWANVASAHVASAANWAGLAEGYNTSAAAYASSAEGFAADAEAAALTLDSNVMHPTPGGRLCVATGVPIPASGSGAATVYYTFYEHDVIYLFDGTDWVGYNFTEMSQALNDDTKSPAAAVADSAYDMFVWLDGSTLRCTRGPAWSSLTARGTGAGTTELERVNGRWVNKIDITNGPAAQRGLYVGSINTIAGAATVSTQLSGDGATVDGVNYGVWNMYNRVPITMRLTDSATSHTYSTTTIRAWGGSTQFQVRLMRGLNEDAVIADVRATVASSSAGDQGVVGVGLDATNAFVGLLTPCRINIANYAHPVLGKWGGLPGLGKHYLSWNEYVGSVAGTLTWYGDANVPTWWQSGMEVIAWA